MTRIGAGLSAVALLSVLLSTSLFGQQETRFRSEGATGSIFLVSTDLNTFGNLRVFRGGPVEQPQTMLTYDIFVNTPNGQDELIGVGLISNGSLIGNGITSLSLTVDTSPSSSPGFSNQDCVNGQTQPCPQGPGGLIMVTWQKSTLFPPRRTEVSSAPAFPTICQMGPLAQLT